jgi:hypothetical protein
MIQKLRASELVLRALDCVWLGILLRIPAQRFPHKGINIQKKKKNLKTKLNVLTDQFMK